MGKVLIADPSPEFCAVLIRTLAARHEVRCCRDGLTALKVAESFAPQVLVVSLALPGLDGFDVIDTLVRKPGHPKIMVLTHYLSAYIEQALAKRPISYAMMKPCDVQALQHRVDELMGLAEQPIIQLPGTADAAAALIYHLGISPLSLSGRYIQAGLDSYLRDPEQPITKTLYPLLARQFGKTPMSVEKAIRQGITQAWEHRDEGVWRQYFQTMPDGTLPRPTNQQFLQVLAQCLQQTCRQKCVK